MHFIAFHCITLQCITLHYITLHTHMSKEGDRPRTESLEAEQNFGEEEFNDACLFAMT